MVCINNKSYAQSVKRQCITSYCTSVNDNIVAVMQTVGQPFNTIAFSEYNNIVLPGFLQPISFRAEKTNTTITKSLDYCVYPNPATDFFQVICRSEIENSDIEVFDLTGKSIVKNYVTQTNSHTITCESWDNGIYILIITDKDRNRTTLKLIINK